MPSKVMLITGASRGIGAKTAQLAAAQGWQVAVNFINNATAANDVVRSIQAQGGQAQAFQADVSDSDQVDRLFNDVDQAFGRLDVLVNNAGILETFAITEATPEKVNRSFAANIFSMYYCSREAVKRMSTRSGGSGGVIVNMSSIASRLGSMPQGNAYTSTKAAADGFNLALAHEVGPQGIRVCGIRPGIIATDIQAGRGGIEKAAEIAAVSTTLGRIGLPEEVAQTVIWLASDAASYVHGTLIDVGGGR
ncbi:MAG: SDR family oxidoreductase [Orrella sp.]|jgi:NAD(P)-dependent dehydrogenase (short-subunit alcohol dehydrogenase family)|uniref:SDR family oxidoreductase n=1 Tax=Orrella sp. TaxID=1921583 RepID=UPI003BCF8E0D